MEENLQWKENFFSSFIEGNLEKASQLCNQNKPETFLKFCNGSYIENNANKYLDSLKDDELWFSSPKEFNDPFDCVFNLSDDNLITQIILKIGDILPNNKKEIFVEVMRDFVETDNKKEAKEIDNKFRNRLMELKKSIFVCCVSENKNLLKSLMWSNYANSHKGFCIEYDSNELIKVVETKHKMPILPVLYSNQFDPISLPVLFSNQNKEKINMSFLLTSTCIKSTEWSYENEWRMVFNGYGRNESGFLLKTCRPKSVYLGCKASEKLKIDLKEICKDKKIKLYQMKMKPNSFELTYEEVDTN